MAQLFGIGNGRMRGDSLKSVTSSGGRPWVWLAAVSLLAALSLPQPCSAFEADGLYSGMSLEDFKKSSFLVGKRVDLFNDTPKNTSYIINGRDRVDFCYGFLSLYTRGVSGPSALSVIIKTAYSSKIITENKNVRTFLINDGKYHYESKLTWILDVSKYSIFVSSLGPIILHELMSESVISAVVDFRNAQPREVMILTRECR